MNTDHSEFNGPTLESNAWDIDSVEIVILFPPQILASVLIRAMKLKILTEQRLVERNSEVCCAGHPRFGGTREAIPPYGSAAGRLVGRAVIETHDHGGIGDDDGIAATLGGYFESAFDRRYGHGAIRQFPGDR